MSDFDKPQFEHLMAEAVGLHGQGRFADALALSTEAYGMAPEDSAEKGRAARDTGARYDRLGNLEEADRWAAEAYAIHDGLVQSMEEPTREVLRERAVSAMYVGVNGLRRIINTGPDIEKNADTSALGYLRQTWGDLQAAKTRAAGLNRHVDQYEVNAARRVSIGESLLGDRRKGIAVGARAVMLAVASESPLLDTSTPELGLRVRMSAKAKAFVGGVAAIGVGILASPDDGRRRRVAVRLASRSL